MKNIIFTFTKHLFQLNNNNHNHNNNQENNFKIIIINRSFLKTLLEKIAYVKRERERNDEATIIVNKHNFAEFRNNFLFLLLFPKLIFLFFFRENKYNICD